MPLGELCDMIACYQIEHGAKELRRNRVHDATEID